MRIKKVSGYSVSRIYVDFMAWSDDVNYAIYATHFVLLAAYLLMVEALGKRKHIPTYAHMYVKFGYSEKATKFEKIFHSKFDATQ